MEKSGRRVGDVEKCLPAPLVAHSSDDRSASTSTTQSTTGSNLNRATNEPYCAYPKWRRWFIVFIASGAAVFGVLSGAIYFPALPVLQDVFHTSAESINGTVSAFMWVMAVGPLFWAPVCDRWGRKMVFLTTTCIFTIANVLLWRLPVSIRTLYAMRIISAAGSCAVMSIANGAIVDLFEPSKQAKAFSFLMQGPHGVTAVGPLIGGAFATSENWRWIFGFLSILGAVWFVLILVLLPETLRCRVGNSSAFSQAPTWFVTPRFYQPHIVHDEERYPKPEPITLKVILPLARNPCWTTVCLINGLPFAALAAMNLTLPRVLLGEYDFTHTSTGAAFIPQGLAQMAGAAVAKEFSDWMRERAEEKRNFAMQRIEAGHRHGPAIQIGRSGVDTTSNAAPQDANKEATVEKMRTMSQSEPKLIPENRCIPLLVAYGFSIVGVFAYGWLVQSHRHWSSILISTVFVAFGVSMTMTLGQAYLNFKSPRHSATVAALLNFFRWSNAGIIVSITRPLRERMGYGWFFTGAAAVNLVGVAVLAVFVFRRLRPERWNDFVVWMKNLFSRSKPSGTDSGTTD